MSWKETETWSQSKGVGNSSQFFVLMGLGLICSDLSFTQQDKWSTNVPSAFFEQYLYKAPMLSVYLLP